VLNSIEYFLSDLILVTCNDFTRAYFKPLPQLSRSQLPPYVTGRYTRELDITKLIKSLIKTLGSNLTALPLLYETSAVALLQKSTIGRGRARTCDSASGGTSSSIAIFL
jgi:hypothetical protein